MAVDMTLTTRWVTLPTPAELVERGAERWVEVGVVAPAWMWEHLTPDDLYALAREELAREFGLRSPGDGSEVHPCPFLPM